MTRFPPSLSAPILLVPHVLYLYKNASGRWQDVLRRQREGNYYMAVCDTAAGLVSVEPMREHDREVVGACWPAVLKAASAAFGVKVSEGWKAREG